MRKMTILSILTASLLITAQADEPKKAETNTTKSEKKVETVTVQIKKSSIGADKSVIDIIKTATNDKNATKSTQAKAEKKSDKNATAKTPFDYKLKPKKVADNVWCFFGALDKPTKENAGFMSNNCYVKTNEGYLVVDTGPSYQFAKQAYAQMKKIADLPVKYVIDSHGHDDHWLGNNFYKEEFNATIIGPESINTDYKEGDKTRMYKVLPKNAIEGTHIVKVDKVVKEPETLKFGGTEFQLTPMKVRAHSVDDIYIYMPKEKVLFAGDLVMNGRITSNRDGSVMGQIKALDMMSKLDWKTLIPGHGYITGEKAMEESKLYFKLLKERILKAIEDGVDATEINDVVKLEEFKDKAMYDILNAHNVGFAYEELEMLDEE